jgi:hypothetical protein
VWHALMGTQALATMMHPEMIPHAKPPFVAPMRRW